MKPYQFIIAVVAAAILFLQFPGVDLSFSRLFYQPGEGFFPRGSLAVDILYELAIVIVYAVAIFVAGAALARLVPRLRRLWVRPRVIAFIALSLALGPGLIVNSLLKDNVGRARPFMIVEFGGAKTFSPALVTSDQCPRNCSFVSGHAAATFFLVTFAFLVRAPRRRRAAMAGALAFGAATGLGRIALGAHFLSDVVFAGFIVYAVAWALHEFLLVRDFKPPPFEPGGRAWRAWQRWAATPGGEAILSFAAVAFLCLALIAYLDRAAALWFALLDPPWHEFFKTLSDLGAAGPYLVVTAIAFAALRLAARFGMFEARAGALKAYSMVAAFFFSAIAASGILINVLKVLFGRVRPKLLFRDELYGFDWFRLGADFHSFPSGHAQTITALMVALFILVPRFGWAYLAVGAAIAMSRAVVNAHYMGDIVAGAYAAALMTMWVHSLFARSGIDLKASLAGSSSRENPRDK
ncbi:MAG: phosphatase PAP2 family protein [Proteobacteria bacterium]|nr:phosphatase PAP2 family protein [Pseudomonadota bacterium]